MKKVVLLLLIILNFTSVAQGLHIGIIASQRPLIETSTPILTNFRIDGVNKDRIYYDSSVDETGMTTTGFVVSGKTITAVNTAENYFTVDTPFNFWDNNTIRLGENDDVVHRQNTLYNFTLSYIQNNIDEPTSSVNRYVAVTPLGSQDGTSEANATSLIYAINNAIGGQTWWVKAGNYTGLSNNDFSNSGTVNSPIKFIGYKTTIGDITSNYYDYGVTPLTSEMPTLNGINDLMQFYNSSFFIVKNFQMNGTDAGSGVRLAGQSHNIVLENINTYEFTSASGVGIKAVEHTQTNALYNVRIENCVSINNNLHNIIIQRDASGGDIGFNLISNCKAYTDYETDLTSDYQIIINGDNSIIRNCYTENFNYTGSGGGGHGIHIRSSTRISSTYNLVEKNEVVNSGTSYAVRNKGVNFNVIKDNIARGHNVNPSADAGGIYIWGGADNNIVERNLIKNLNNTGIMFWNNQGEDGGIYNETGNNNIVRNNIISNTQYAIQAESTSLLSTCNDNKIYANTFYNIDRFYRNDGNVTISNLEFKNNIIENAPLIYNSMTNFVIDYNNIHSSWATTIGTNSINVDSQFISATNFEPQNALLLVVPKLNMVSYDYNYIERAETTTIGAINYANEANILPIATLSNFLITDAEPSRVYFDSDVSVSSMNLTGFVISGKTITSLNTSEKYFTVNTPFTFWDNNTIRLGEHNDISHRQSALYNFTLEYIENNIVEPTANTVRYITNTATGSNDGTTEVLAWTWQQAAINAVAGMTINVRAGDYNDTRNVVHSWLFSKDGTVDNPIKFIGYKTTPGDITSNYYDYGVTMSSSEMPTFVGLGGNDSDYSKAMIVDGEYLIFKNIQMSDWYTGIRSNSSGTSKFSNIVFENVNTKNNTNVDNPTGNNGYGFLIHGLGIGQTGNIRFKNCLSLNADMVGFNVQFTSGFNAFLGCKVYNDNTDSFIRTDYAFAVNSVNNIIKGCYIENFNSTTTNSSTHGYDLRAGNTPVTVLTSFNLIDNCTATNYNEAYNFRNTASFNVVKNSKALNNNAFTKTNDYSGGVCFYGAGNYNIAENMEMRDISYPVYYRGDGAQTSDIGMGEFNIIRNSLILDCKFAFYFLDDLSGTPNMPNNNNGVYNCTFDNCANMWAEVAGIVHNQFDIVNCVLTNFDGEGFGYNLNDNNYVDNDFFNNTGFWDNTIVNNGGGILEDPNYISISNFEPQNINLLSSIRLFGIEKDYFNSKREVTTTIGAINHINE